MTLLPTAAFTFPSSVNRASLTMMVLPLLPPLNVTLISLLSPMNCPSTVTPPAGMVKVYSSAGPFAGAVVTRLPSALRVTVRLNLLPYPASLEPSFSLMVIRSPVFASVMEFPLVS